MSARGDDRPGLIRRARGCLVSLAVLLASVAVLGFVAYQLSAPLLAYVGGLLVHEDPLAPADAIAVLGGGGLDRDLEAADLFSAGYAPIVLLTRTPERPVVAELRSRGLDVSTELESRVRDLGEFGVPAEAITVLEREVESTQAEAELIAEWAQSRQAGRIIVVTSTSHTSRARLVFDRVLPDRRVAIVVRSSRASGFDPASWWRRRSDRRDVLVELEKHAYYRLMYLLRQTP